MNKWSLSVFFPCYNEEANVVSTTLAALEACRGITSDFEIIIVNDGSSDNTGQLADDLASTHAEIRVIHHPTNRGYGAALQTGFRSATREWVFYTDGDGQFDFREIPRLLKLAGRYDIICGYRARRRDPWIRLLNARGWTTLCNLVFGLRLRDVDCAFKVFPRRLFNEIELKSEGALISAEILVRADRRGYRIGQVGVSHYARKVGFPTGANLRVILKAFVELVKLRRHILKG